MENDYKNGIVISRKTVALATVIGGWIGLIALIWSAIATQGMALAIVLVIAFTIISICVLVKISIGIYKYIVNGPTKYRSWYY